ncbi:hypothetical protein [Actomonas aquatica]|uniref:Glycosyltransferase RgtA/B/C/D-like domain-containing protein n=1 Tax=Actomonas aquatica TaxID=2866162 RepID=A0ABZ1CC02_9BACT|nr:hypothetical protein [Opitutus sp. WL0086]WRQ89185.1 hypothetical protein K1X11_007180 [Opitutus sp. WL0086]
MSTSPSRSRFWRTPVWGLVAAGLLVTGLLLTKGPYATWQWWGFVASNPAFYDTQVITAGAESFREGHDPLRENPADLGGRPLNYPRIWHQLFALGIDRSDTPILGGFMLGCFLLTLALFVHLVRGPPAWWWFGAILSPAILLGLERGNTDILAFALVAAATCLTAVGRSRAASAAIVFAGALKLFPFAAAPLLLGGSRRRAPWLVFLSIIIGLLYVLANRDDLQLIRDATPLTYYLSFGYLAFGLGAEQHFGFTVATLPLWVPVLLLAIATLIPAVRSLRAAPSPAPDTAPDLALTGFLGGTSIYLASFLLGSSFNYRLTFLLLVLPQLHRWLRSPAHRPFAVVALACTYLVWWFPLPQPVNPFADGLVFVLDQLSHWILFLTLGGLTGSLAPRLDLFPAGPLSAWFKRQPSRQAPRPSFLPAFARACLIVVLGVTALWFARTPHVESAAPASLEELLLLDRHQRIPDYTAFDVTADLGESGPATLALLELTAANDAADARRLTVFVLAALWMAAWSGLSASLGIRRSLLASLPLWLALAWAPFAFLQSFGSAPLVWAATTMAVALLWVAQSQRPIRPVLAGLAGVFAACSIALLPWLNLPGFLVWLLLLIAGLPLAQRHGPWWRRSWFLLAVGLPALTWAWVQGDGRLPDLLHLYFGYLGHPSALGVALWTQTLGGLAVITLLMAGGLALTRRLDTRSPLPIALAVAATALPAHWVAQHREPATPAATSAIVDVLNQFPGRLPHDRLGVWGVRPGIYRETGLTPATLSPFPLAALAHADSGANRYLDRYFGELSFYPPEFLVDTIGPGDPFYSNRSTHGHEAYPKLAAWLETHYVLIRDVGSGRLYVRHRQDEGRDLTRPNILPVTLEDMQETEAMVAPFYLPEFPDHVRFFAHAPARFVLAAPPQALRLSGTFGFRDGVTDSPEGHTDGCVFRIVLRSVDRPPVLLLEQTLDPYKDPARRLLQGFTVDLPADRADNATLELQVDPRGNPSFDWAFWGDLEFVLTFP